MIAVAPGVDVDSPVAIDLAEFVRQPIRVVDIRGPWAVVSSAAPLDTPVVTLGGSELLGVEYGVGEE